MFEDHLANQKKINISLARLLPRLQDQYAKILSKTSTETEDAGWEPFRDRLIEHFPRLFTLYYQLYAQNYDFFYHLEDLLLRLMKSWLDRSAELKVLDNHRENFPDWFQSEKMVGGVCYVDLFAGDLSGIRSKIPYFKELGLNYLHLMPLFKVPAGENDGGYAVSSYRDVDPRLGTMDELRKLSNELRESGISLVLDLVFNHTSDEHEWARKALDGDEYYQAFYRMFPDRSMPDAYERNMREIFPDEHPGAFTYRPEIRHWVWTTFHSYQWDLNYANPAVFNHMADEMLYLANVGVEVLRLDAVAFIWKQLGTGSENLPEAHLLIQAFNAVARIAAPSLMFKSEAIVHPDEVVKYIRPDECQLSYNPLVMSLMWNSLATREVQLLDQALRERFKIPVDCAWVNYIRCHDDIGWTFSDEDASRLGINGYDHRKFLNDFYTGRFEGSFARGLPFQENPKTGDARISGTCASLAGLEKALDCETEWEVELAIRRILLLHGVMMTLGGIPLIYLGDETGVLNDYKYRKDPAKAHDSRWVHRPATNWDEVELRNDLTSIQGRIFQALSKFIEMRKSTVCLSGHEMQVMNTGNNHVLGFLRISENRRAIILANFSEAEQHLQGNLLRIYGIAPSFTDLITKQRIAAQEIILAPYQLLCLV